MKEYVKRVNYEIAEYFIKIHKKIVNETKEMYETLPTNLVPEKIDEINYAILSVLDPWVKDFNTIIDECSTKTGPRIPYAKKTSDQKQIIFVSIAKSNFYVAWSKAVKNCLCDTNIKLWKQKWEFKKKMDKKWLAEKLLKPPLRVNYFAES